MFIGILQFELIVSGSTSLKDKRRVVRSVKDSLHRAHQVSVAEVAALDNHRFAVMGLAVVANTAPRAAQVLDSIVNKLHRLRDAELGRCRREIVKGETLCALAVDQPDANWSFPADERRQAELLIEEPDR